MPDNHFVPIILRDINSPWERVLPRGVPASFPRGAILESTGLPSKTPGMYYIRQGRVRLSYLGLNGEEKYVFYMARGSFFGEIPILHESPAPGIFTIMEDVSATFLAKALITEVFIQENPDLALNLFTSLSLKARSFYAQLCSTGMYDAFTNVCRMLYSMHLHNRERGVVVPVLSQQEVASLLGIHRSTLHVALTRLKKEGIIGKYSRNRLDILAPDRLYCYTGVYTP